VIALLVALCLPPTAPDGFRFCYDPLPYAAVPCRESGENPWVRSVPPWDSDFVYDWHPLSEGARNFLTAERDSLKTRPGQECYVEGLTQLLTKGRSR